MLGSFSLPGSAAIKCWTNKEGVKECGNNVPPEYAQQGHQELSKQGMLKEEQKAVKTKEELEAEAITAAAKKEAKLKQEQQAKEDKILLQTFSSVADIELARNERIKAVDASIKLAQKRTETIQADLDKRIQSAAADERAGKTPGDALLKDIESLRRQIGNNNDYIEAKHMEQEQTNLEYTAKIERYKELKPL